MRASYMHARLLLFAVPTTLPGTVGLRRQVCIRCIAVDTFMRTRDDALRIDERF